MDDDVLEWNLMFDDILYEKYLWLKWPECINFCRTLHLDEGGVIYNKANVIIKMWARISDVLDPQREALWLFNRAVVTEKSGLH